MAIESGIALATILRNWASDDLSAALTFYQGIRKPRTDKVTRTSYEAGLLASAELPDSFTFDFNPEALKDRMKWILKEDVLATSLHPRDKFFPRTPGTGGCISVWWYAASGTPVTEIRPFCTVRKVASSRSAV